MTTWITTWRHEAERQARQRTASADRRAAAIEEGKQSVGSYSAVAEHLGITPAAVSDARANARHRPHLPPMADYIELDLPRVGDAVPTPDEWAALPENEQPDAARRAARHWRSVWHAAGRMLEPIKHDYDVLGDILVAEDWDSDDDLLALVADRLPHLKHRTRADVDAYFTTLIDLERALRDKISTAIRQTDEWQLRTDPPTD